MIGKAKIIAVCLVALLALVVVPSIAQAEPPPAAEIAAIQAEINACRQAKEEYREALNRGLLALHESKAKEAMSHFEAAWDAGDQATAHGQSAVDLANNYYGTNVAGVVCNPFLEGDGATYPNGNIAVANKGLASPGWLASTIIHEARHRQQFASGALPQKAADRRECTEVLHKAEIEAYQAELNAAGDTGLTVPEIQRIRRKIQFHQSRLTIFSTAGGSVTQPGEGEFLYPRSAVVSLVATADAGHRFLNWTGDVGTIVDVNAASTNITMSGNYSITANFQEEEEEPQDASIKFLTWTIDGERVKPSTPELPCMVTLCDIIDVQFQQHVAGREGHNVTVNETSLVKLHWTYFEGPIPPAGVLLNVVNAICAVNKTPEPRYKWSQVPSINGIPVKPGGEPAELPFCMNMTLDVETRWELVKCTNYTKAISWLRISKAPFELCVEVRCALFNLVVPVPGQYTFTLEASAEVALVDDVDVNLGNNKAVSPPLYIVVIVP